MVSRQPPFPEILIDTREQLPYEFNGYPTKRIKIAAGDYSLAGFHSWVSVERKSAIDMYGCVGGGRERFLRHLRLLACVSRPAIVIEADLQEFAQGNQRTRITPAQAVGSVISWACEFRIPVFFCPDRAYAERIVLRWLMAWWRHHLRDTMTAPKSALKPTTTAP